MSRDDVMLALMVITTTTQVFVAWRDRPGRHSDKE